MQTDSAPSATAEKSVQSRIDRARALAAAHQLAASARELESVRAAADDAVLRDGACIMLIGIYLEEGNYSRAQSLLEESFQQRSSGKNSSQRSYFALAGQAVNGVRQRLARYRAFGVTVTGSTLPPEAANDLERLRLLLERMVAQAIEMTGETPNSNDVLALLEDVLGVRVALARDQQDREKWQTEYAQARKQLGFSRMQLARESPARTKPGAGQTSSPENGNPAGKNSSQNGDGGSAPLLNEGALNQRARSRVVPAYPQLARSTGTQGVVKVHVIVDETGNVHVTKSEGPTVLRQAAEEAARGWRFSPTLVDGKPTKFAGYIEFSFEL
jgi:TonB family protein